jgi:hypothetical protein
LCFILRGKRLKGEWHLLRMGARGGKRNNWLLIKFHDQYANEKWRHRALTGLSKPLIGPQHNSDRQRQQTVGIESDKGCRTRETGESKKSHRQEAG